MVSSSRCLKILPAQPLNLCESMQPTRTGAILKAKGEGDM